MNDVPTSSPLPEVLLLTRQGCHLCEAARQVVDRVCSDFGVPWQERSVDDDPDYLARFSEEIPVLMVNGIQRDFWHIDEARLRRLLAS